MPISALRISMGGDTGVIFYLLFIPQCRTSGEIYRKLFSLLLHDGGGMGCGHHGVTHVEYSRSIIKFERTPIIHKLHCERLCTRMFHRSRGNIEITSVQSVIRCFNELQH